MHVRPFSTAPASSVRFSTLFALLTLVLALGSPHQLSPPLGPLAVLGMFAEMLRVMLLADTLPLLAASIFLVSGHRWRPDPVIVLTLHTVLILGWMLPQSWSAEVVRTWLPVLPFAVLTTGYLSRLALPTKRHLLMSPMLLAGGWMLLGLPLQPLTGTPCLGDWTPEQMNRACGLFMLLLTPLLDTVGEWSLTVWKRAGERP